MAAKQKRTRVTAKHEDAQKYPAGDFTISLREIREQDGDYTWSTWLVQGWKESDKWKRRKFKNKKDAETFIFRKQVELKNHSGTAKTVITRLTQEQIDQAEAAFLELGDRYNLKEAVAFYLANFCDPDFKISIKDAGRKFLDGKEREGVRDRSLTQLKSTVTRFESFVENCDIHEVTVKDVERFLKSLRAKNGVDKASQKTWNNYRADLSSFFNWCADPQRGWIMTNPAAKVTKFKKIDRDLPDILTPEEARKLMDHVAGIDGGKLVRYFALALFAGIRTGPKGELAKLARHPKQAKLIDLKRGVIHIPPEVSKTGQKRQIMIRPNLRDWLEHSPWEILPTNHDRLIKAIRKEKKLTHDVLRHSFFSYHVAAFRSVGDAAIEGGNTEAVVKKHYLNLATKGEGEEFWSIAYNANVQSGVKSERLQIVA